MLRGAGQPESGGLGAGVGDLGAGWAKRVQGRSDFQAARHERDEAGQSGFTGT